MQKNIKSKSYECCIVGAGPAGLGAALELTKHGINNILIIDKNKSVGGLSRTDIFDGIRFDVGPHRFFTKNEEINKIWHDILGENFHTVSRLTRIYYKNKYFEYPIKPFNVLVKLGILESLNIIFSFLCSQIGKRTTAVTFEDWVVQRFGRKLYEVFFKTYTEKVWGVPCNQISAEWAEQRIKGLDALEVIKNAFFAGRKKKAKTLIENFDYPVFGAGQMYEAISAKVVSQGVQLMLDTKVMRFNRKGNVIQSIDVVDLNGTQINITAKYFFSSIPIAHFFKMLEPADQYLSENLADKIRYRSHITVDLLINKQQVFPDQWIYIHSPDIQIARIANYNNFSKAMVGSKNKTALSVEYFVFKNDKLWNESDESLKELAAIELAKIGLVKKSEIEKAWVVREEEAYPAHYVGFQQYYDSLKSVIGQFSNFFSIGRAGLHKYNNQDHSFLSGMLAARNYLKLPGYPYALWDINTEPEYLEKCK